MCVQFLQGAQLCKGPNGKAFLSCFRGYCEAGSAEIQRNLTVKKMARKPVSQHLIYWICGEQGSSVSFGMIFQMRTEEIANSTSSQHLTKSLVYSRNTFTFVCELRATYWNVMRRSQNILQSSPVKGAVGILKKTLSHQLIRYSLKVNMQIHLKPAVSRSLVHWVFIINQRVIFQALCWVHAKSLIFFHNNVSLAFWVRTPAVLKIKSNIAGPFANNYSGPNLRRCWVPSLPLHSWGTCCTWY